MLLDYSDMEPSQDRVINELYERDGCLAIVPMGGGKTVCGLTAFKELQHAGFAKRLLVIAPKRVAADVWPKEPKAWAHLQNVRVAAAVGSPAQREAAFEGGADVVTIGVDNLPWLNGRAVDLLGKTRWAVFIDESTKLQLVSGTRAKAWKHMRTRKDLKLGPIWAGTGTPGPNELTQLFGQVYAVVGGDLWGNSFTRWRNKFFWPTDPEGQKWEPREGAPKQLARDLARVSVVVQEDELPKRPAPRIIDIDVSITAEAKRAYKALKEGIYFPVGRENDPIVPEGAGVIDGKLWQISQGFLYDTDDLTETRETIHLHDAKMAPLVDMVDELQGHPLLIAYAFQEDLRRLREQFPHLATLDDPDIVDRWNAGSVPLLAMHPASGGHGLNLQFGGNYACWYSIPYSNELYQQFNKRIDRPGQTKRVTIYRIRARNTRDKHRTDTVLAGRAAQEAQLMEDMKL